MFANGSTAGHVAGAGLPESIGTMTGPLAEAHTPLSLLAVGMTMDFRRPNLRQVRLLPAPANRVLAGPAAGSCALQMKDVSTVLALRLVPMLAAAAAASVVAPQYAAMVAIAGLCSVSPIAREVSLSKASLCVDEEAPPLPLTGGLCSCQALHGSFAATRRLRSL